MKVGVLLHPKCASVYFQKVFDYILKSMAMEYKVIERGGRIAKNPDHEFYIVKSANSEDEALRKAVHIYRDPRDMLISGVFSAMYSHPADNHPKLQNHRKALLEAKGDEERLLLQMDYMEDIYKDLRGWNGREKDTLTIPFEEYFSGDESHQLGKLLEMVGYLGISPSKEVMEEAVRKFSFKSLSGGRSPGQEDAKHHYRSGTSGGWNEYFSNWTVKAEFERRFGDIVISLGYKW